MSDDEIREATRGFLALLTGYMSDLDDGTLARLAGEVQAEGGPRRRSIMLGVAVGVVKDLIHELAAATDRTEEEILRECAARWTR